MGRNGAREKKRGIETGKLSLSWAKKKKNPEKVFKQRENVYNSLAEEVGSEDDREGVTLTSH